MTVLILQSLNERLNCRFPDLSEGIYRNPLDINILILQKLNQRFNGSGVSDVSKSICRDSPDINILILQSVN